MNDATGGYFLVQVEGLGATVSGKPITLYLEKDKFGPGQDGFVAKPEIATHFRSMPLVDRWLEANPYWAMRAVIVHQPTGTVIRP